MLVREKQNFGIPRVLQKKYKICEGVKLYHKPVKEIYLKSSVKFIVLVKLRASFFQFKIFIRKRKNNY